MNVFLAFQSFPCILCTSVTQFVSCRVLWWLHQSQAVKSIQTRTHPDIKCCVGLHWEGSNQFPFLPNISLETCTHHIGNTQVRTGTKCLYWTDGGTISPSAECFRFSRGFGCFSAVAALRIGSRVCRCNRKQAPWEGVLMVFMFKRIPCRILGVI